MNAQKTTQKKIENDTILFPFGCNLSQIKAVKNASR